MTVKERIVEYLESNRGEYISGEQLANELEVSRTAIWKAIKGLQKDGFSIEAVTNKGYMLTEDTDVLTQNGVCAHLTNENIRVEVYKSVTSTNLVLKDRAASENEGLVIASMEQTGGLGRLGRSFYSPNDTGIYFSILLKPQIDNDEITLLTSIAAVAVCEAIEACSDLKPQIKWVNDVFLNDKKVCGILTQASFSMENFAPEYVVVGIGINVYEPQGGFGKDIQNIAGAIFNEKQGDMKNKLLANVLDRFFYYYENFAKKEFIQGYKERSFTIGKKVNVIKANEERIATAISIDDSCHLLVEYEDGSRENLSTGEISVRPV